MDKKKVDKVKRKRLELDSDYIVAINDDGDDWKVEYICGGELYSILNSKDNTEKELMDFIKKNSRYNLFKEFAKVFLLIDILFLILIIINFKLNSSELRIFVWGFLLAQGIINIIGSICVKHNDKIDTQKLLFKLNKMRQKNEEALKKLNEQLNGEENECKD